MEGFSLRMSARTVQDARLLLEMAADLLDSDSIAPEEERLLRLDEYEGASRHSAAFLLVYTDRPGVAQDT